MCQVGNYIEHCYFRHSSIKVSIDNLVLWINNRELLFLNHSTCYDTRNLFW